MLIEFAKIEWVARWEQESHWQGVVKSRFDLRCWSSLVGPYSLVLVPHWSSFLVGSRSSLVLVPYWSSFLVGSRSSLVVSTRQDDGTCFGALTHNNSRDI
jgi:hypothetical protein